VETMLVGRQATVTATAYKWSSDRDAGNSRKSIKFSCAGGPARGWWGSGPPKQCFHATLLRRRRSSVHRRRMDCATYWLSSISRSVRRYGASNDVGHTVAGGNSNDLGWLWTTAKFPTTRSIERPLCDSWASCLWYYPL